MRLEALERRIFFRQLTLGYSLFLPPRSDLMFLRSSGSASMMSNRQTGICQSDSPMISNLNCPSVSYHNPSRFSTASITVINGLYVNYIGNDKPEICRYFHTFSCILSHAPIAFRLHTKQHSIFSVQLHKLLVSSDFRYPAVFNV